MGDALTEARARLAGFEALHLIAHGPQDVERDAEYEVISSEDRTEYSLVTVDTAPDDPRRIGCPRVVRRFHARSWEQATGWYEATMEDDGARAGDVARIAEWVRTQADESRVELGQQQPAEEPAYLRGEWIALTAIADAIERGDWYDAPLPPDARDARIAELEAAAPKWVRRFDAAPWFLVVGTVRLPGSGIVRHPTTDRYWETETCDEHPNEVAAARAVCARLGLPEILTGLSDAAGVPEGIST